MDPNYDGSAYRQTADIVRGKRSIDPGYLDLAAAVSERFTVEVVNIVQDTFRPTASHPERVRLWVWLRTQIEADSFSDAPFHYDLVKQQYIASLAEAVLRRGHGRRTTKLLARQAPFIVFASFETAAIDEAFMGVSEAQLETLRLSLANQDLWKIQRIFARVMAASRGVV